MTSAAAHTVRVAVFILLWPAFAAAFLVYAASFLAYLWIAIPLGAKPRQ